jgi:hypothetical protein
LVVAKEARKRAERLFSDIEQDAECRENASKKLRQSQVTNHYSWWQDLGW